MSWVQGLGFFVNRHIAIAGDVISLPEHEPFVLIANHYTWLDILVLYARLFRKNTSFVFVMKRSLIYLPFIGLICWGLGHPLVERGSRSKKNQAILKQGAKKAREYNYGIAIFPEGTRYTGGKKKSIYRHLLKPHAAGLDHIVQEMGVKKIVDVTLIYEKKKITIWDFLRKRVGEVKIKVEILSDLGEIKPWLLNRWDKKDQVIAEERSLYQATD